jgi:hypothetical protein
MRKVLYRPSWMPLDLDWRSLFALLLAMTWFPPGARWTDPPRLAG